MASIIIGENCKIIRSLFYSDGTTVLPVADLFSLTAEVIQYEDIRASYVLRTDAELTGSANQVILNIPESVSTKFRVGEVWIRLKMKKNDVNYTDTYQYDIDEFTPFEAVR